MANKKNIWIINEYAGSPYHGMEFRHYYIAKELSKLGFDVTVVTSSYSHLFKNPPKVSKSYEFETIDSIKYLWVKTFNYGKSQNKKRVLKWFYFAFKLYFLPFKKMTKPDFILFSPMAQFSIFPINRITKKFNAKLIYEVKDIWPASLVEVGGFSKTHPFIKLMKRSEKFTLKKANYITSNLQNYDNYLKTQDVYKGFTWLSNAIDLEELKTVEKLSAEVLNSIPTDKFIVGYTGTVGVANALDYFCESYSHLTNKKDIAFVIVGDGQEKEKLQKKYSEIYFIDSIPKRQVQSMLAEFDACLIGLKKEKLFKFGVSPNKLFDYMYSGKPIVYAIDSGENVIDVADCGIVVESENAKSYAEGIDKLFNMKKEERVRLGENGKKYVLENFTFSKIATKFANLLNR